jgi:hypothetical protein
LSHFSTDFEVYHQILRLFLVQLAISTIFCDYFWTSMFGYFIIFVTTRVLVVSMREQILDDTMYYDASLSNGGLSAYSFAIAYGLFGTCLIRLMMTKAVLAQV